jgi:hypothetical protein
MRLLVVFVTTVLTSTVLLSTQTGATPIPLSERPQRPHDELDIEELVANTADRDDVTVRHRRGRVSARLEIKDGNAITVRRNTPSNGIRRRGQGRTAATLRNSDSSLEVLEHANGVRFVATSQNAADLSDLEYNVSIPGDWTMRPGDSTDGLTSMVLTPESQDRIQQLESAGLQNIISIEDFLETAYIIADENGVAVAEIAQPWAIDATGRLLPTSFELEGHTIIQHVDATDAQYPIVSDPSLHPSDSYGGDSPSPNLTEAEKEICFNKVTVFGYFIKWDIDPFAVLICFKAGRAAQRATQAVNDVWPQCVNHNTGCDRMPANSFRHAYWNFLMAKDMGLNTAKRFADAHEQFDANIFTPNWLMDLLNNEKGRRVWDQNRNLSRADGKIALVWTSVFWNTRLAIGSGGFPIISLPVDFDRMYYIDPQIP